MATFPFLGSGSITEAFNIDYALISRPLLLGETRLRSPFPYPELDAWRRAALTYTAATPTTGSSDIATRGRTTLLFAHEADLSSIFFDVTPNTEELIAGYYVDKRKAQDVDVSLTSAYQQTARALAELRGQGVPVQYADLLQLRLESAAFNHRVAGLCAAVYLTGIILAEDQK
jgi:hypothetical protein